MSVQHNKDEIMEQSIVRDIFGGELKTEFIIENTKKVNVTYEPFYVLNLEIPRECFSLQECLGAYFTRRQVKDY